MEEEIRRYLKWAGQYGPAYKELERKLSSYTAAVQIRLTEETQSSLEISDAESDILFSNERRPLTWEGYLRLKKLALVSAEDFQRLFDSMPDASKALFPPRNTFYGPLPCTTREIYEYTMNVNSYYFGEIGVTAEDGPDIAACRREGSSALEKIPGFLQNSVQKDSFGEEWSLRKVCRRFIWHDCIHARAMYRRACNFLEKSAF